MSEIEPRLAPLAEQARRAVEYGQLNNELQGSVIGVVCIAMATLTHEFVSVREQAEQEQSHKVRQLEVVLQGLDEQINTLRATRQQTQLQIGEVRKTHADANDTVKNSSAIWPSAKSASSD